MSFSSRTRDPPAQPREPPSVGMIFVRSAVIREFKLIKKSSVLVHPEFESHLED